MGKVLLVGAGRHQRRVIHRAHELGLEVVAVDRNAEAPGLEEADVGEVVDFQDVGAVAEVGRRHGVGGVVTFAAERAVPVVASVAEQLGLPGIGSETAHRMTHKVAQRRTFAEEGVPQPRFAAARDLHEARAALETVGTPAVLKPVDSAGQRGLFLLESVDDLERHLHAALAESLTGEAIVESYEDGREVNTLLVVRNGEPTLVTLSDRIRPQGLGFGVAMTHLFPSTLYGYGLEQAEEVAPFSLRALGMTMGVGYPQLLVAETGEIQVVEVAARIPGGQMVDVALHGAGVDLIEIALRQSLGEEIPDDVVQPKFTQPLAILFLTAEPGPLPTGRVKSFGGLDRVLSFPGVVQADLFLTEGEVIQPVQRDGDRRGYVIALGDTNLEALERAEAAARLVDVEVE
ncbi:MAG: ATP-grasp domain-containing protein [Actinomycetota bacterium]|nr:ATP-grasp domain-containing protein [Actinomycetota bacterium]